MKFVCDRCRKRFSTVDEPVPGRTYRVPCRCGNTIVIRESEAPAPPPIPRVPRREPRAARSSPPPLPAAPVAALAAAPASSPPPAAWAAADADVSAMVDDLFARAMRPSFDLRAAASRSDEDVTPTLLAPLAAPRDPDALDVSSAYVAATAPDAFTNALRRSRTHAFALGGATGAAVGAALALVATALVLRPASPAAGAPPPSTDVVLAAAEPTPPSPPRAVAGRKARSAAPAGASSPRTRVAGVAPDASAETALDVAREPAIADVASIATARKVGSAADGAPPLALDGAADAAPSPGPEADRGATEPSARAPGAQPESAAPLDSAAAEPPAPEPAPIDAAPPAPSDPAPAERGAPEPAATADAPADAIAADAPADAR